MYRGFNLSYLSFGEAHGFKEAGRRTSESHEEIVERTLDAFVLANGRLDGNALQNDWFPEIPADVFISHSHADEELALALFGWLEHRFGLRAFVDSSVWGYSDDLLKVLDDKYCRIPGRPTYSYEKRNGSTSHVHMILSTALGMMIDKAECLLFLNTPQAITTTGAISRTDSPWLFAEIAMTRIVRQTPRKRLIRSALAEKKPSIGPPIQYNVDLSHLMDIGPEELERWSIAWDRGKSHALDSLYGIVDSR